MATAAQQQGLRRPRTLGMLVLFALALGLGLGLGGGCAPGDYGRSPSRGGGDRGEGPGGREQPLALNPRQEWAIARRAYDEVIQQYRSRLLPDRHPQVRRVRQVTARLAKAAAIEPLQREINLRVRGYRFEWEANVVRAKEVNAFCLPAGKVFVFTGILDEVIGGDDDHLATVLSHEVAHALAHHASERLARRQQSANILRSLYYERWQESEADKIGVFLMAFAGFDPDKAAGLWERMRRVSRDRGGAQPIEFLSSHPSHESRSRNLAEWAPRARKAKQAYDRGHIAPPPPDQGTERTNE